MALSAAFTEKVNEVAKNLGIMPDWLIAVMGFETGWTFSPSIRNKSTGATGLIQFMPSTAKLMGTSTDALAAMDAITQMDWVQKYFKGQIAQYGVPKDLGSTYMLVFYPVATIKPSSYVFSDSVYKVNKVFDTTGKGYFTKSDVQKVIEEAAKKKGIPVGRHSLLSRAYHSLLTWL